jgi:hypothetical protein
MKVAEEPSGEALAAVSFHRETWYQQPTKEPGR